MKMVMDIKENLGGEVPVHRLIRCFEDAVFRNEPRDRIDVSQLLRFRFVCRKRVGDKCLSG